jgi:CRISPR-associated protein Csa1
MSVYYTLEDINEWVTTANTKKVDISEEMRGWRWHDYPLQTAYTAPLGVSDITSGLCDSFRIVYLKYVEKVKQTNNAELQKGALLHEIHADANEAAKRNIYKIYWEHGELKPEQFLQAFTEDKQNILQKAKKKYPLIPHTQLDAAVQKLWMRATINYTSALNRALTRSKHLNSPDPIASLVAPVITEYPIDGTKIGLTQAIRADGFLPQGIIIEIKTHQPLEANKYALAGYALAYEAQHLTPINYGVFIHVQYNWENSDFTTYAKLTPITDELRQGFIELRDQAQKIVAEKIDPKLPPKCNPRCPYLKHCNT